ncbi:Uncharacterised protein [Mycobacteroides abscessus subsp. abscessus]|nr:Uncharacterised protein [Mycobacteroides abscessus subsp. abscessus]
MLSASISSTLDLMTASTPAIPVPPSLKAPRLADSTSSAGVNSCTVHSTVFAMPIRVTISENLVPTLMSSIAGTSPLNPV